MSGPDSFTSHPSAAWADVPDVIACDYGTADHGRACNRCSARLEMLEEEMQRVRQHAVHAHSENAELIGRIEALKVILRKLAQRCTLPSAVHKDLDALMANAVPPARNSITAEDSPDEFNIDESDTDAVAPQVWDYPLSRGEKLVRLHQLFTNELRVAREEMQQLRGERGSRCPSMGIAMDAAEKPGAVSAVANAVGATKADASGPEEDFGRQLRDLVSRLEHCDVSRPAQHAGFWCPITIRSSTLRTNVSI
mmetsp:Transcript_87954/g.247123  ORF Transcript_87954/g.247123 Transcript_87954/m.247123 type:complete len:252 (+) Transcript_87954:46-801(+)